MEYYYHICRQSNLHLIKDILHQMTTRFYFSLLVGCVMAASVYGVPARRTPLVVTQPDGTQLTITLMGDEFVHYYVTNDGLPVGIGEDGFYYYLNDDGATLSDIVAKNPDDRSETDQQLLESIDRAAALDGLNRRGMVQRAKRKALPQQRAARAATTEGDIHGLILLVNFSDVKFVTPVEDVEAMMNEEGYSKNGSIGSARDYFIDQSGGKFSPTFDVVGPIDLPMNMAYYGGNDSRGNDLRPEQMVAQACRTASRQFDVDFSRYDNDGDGMLDLVFLIYAGYNEAEGAEPNTIWPHMFYLTATGQNLRIDGCLVDTYACTSELTGSGPTSGQRLAGIGTFVHEFSHTLGLPDFYNTDNADDFTLDVWSVMDYGNYNADGYVPVGYSAYERAFCGWTSIRDLGVAPQAVTLENVAKSFDACKIVNPDDENEYFIFESRAQEGWDQYLPSSGLMITSVAYDQDAWDSNDLNNGSKKRVYVVAADNIYNGYTLAGDLYPYMDNDAFTASSRPAMQTYSGAVLDRPVTAITKDDETQTVTFDYLGGAANAVPVPVALPAGEVTPTSFVASWEPVATADSYRLTVWMTDGEESDTTVYDNLTVTEMPLEGLVEGANYYYTVAAHQGEYDSVESNVISVHSGSGIASGEMVDVSVYAVDGTIIVTGAGDAVAAVYDLAGVRVASSQVVGGMTRLVPGAPGIYVVRVGETVRKVVVD